MDSTFAYAYLIGAIISIITLISFFVLCYNVAQLKKYFVDGIRPKEEKKEEPAHGARIVK